MIVRQRVTWVRWERGAQRISHPHLWVWTDEDGYERCFDTRREAEAARAERQREDQM